MEEKKW